MDGSLPLPAWKPGQAVEEEPAGGLAKTWAVSNFLSPSSSPSSLVVLAYGHNYLADQQPATLAQANQAKTGLPKDLWGQSTSASAESPALVRYVSSKPWPLFPASWLYCLELLLSCVLRKLKEAAR